MRYHSTFQFLGVLALPLLASSCLASPSDTLASAHVATKAGDINTAIQLHRDYLVQASDAPDAAKETLHLGYLLLKQRAPVSDIKAVLVTLRDKYPAADEVPEAEFRLAMIAVREKNTPNAKTLLNGVSTKYKGTPWAAQARFALAHYLIKEKQFDQAIAGLSEVADDPNSPTDVAAEALLETGFLHLQKFFAVAPTAPPDGGLSVTTESEQQASLTKAQQRLKQVSAYLGQHTGDAVPLQTAAAYAECGVAETYLLQGLPEQSEIWYRAALSRDAMVVQAPVRTLAYLGLGISLFRQARYSAASEAFDKVLDTPKTGAFLHGLVIPDTVVSQAKVWHARVSDYMGQGGNR